jgi:hypothetical protein
MKLTASAAVAVIAILSACGDARDLDEGGGGGGALHPLPFDVPQHTAAARANIASCTLCHGADFGGGAVAQTSCNDCHAAAAPDGAGFADDWRDNCTFCHGSGRDPAWSGDLTAVAPPQSADGAGAQDNTNRKVGAHQAHLTAGTFSNPLSCDSCHAVPPLTFAGGSLAHVNGINDPQFSTTATRGVATPGYTRATGTCAVACHGSTPALGNLVSPEWTTTPVGSIACGDCHSVTAPPDGTTGQHNLHLVVFASCGVEITCATCHPNYSATPGSETVNLATHMNGFFDADPVTTGALSQLATGAAPTWPGCTDCHNPIPTCPP